MDENGKMPLWAYKKAAPTPQESISSRKIEAEAVGCPKGELVTRISNKRDRPNAALGGSVIVVTPTRV